MTEAESDRGALQSALIGVDGPGTETINSPLPTLGTTSALSQINYTNSGGEPRTVFPHLLSFFVDSSV